MEHSKKDYLLLDKKYSWHPLFQHSLLETQELMLITEAHGTTVVDSEGNEYLDAFSGLWNVNIGYSRHEVAQAVYEQMKQLSYYPQTQVTIPPVLLAEQLISLLKSSPSSKSENDLNRVVFVNSGSEANETALKMVRQYGLQKYQGQNRYKVISLYRGYHGFTYGAISASGQTPRRRKFEPLLPGFCHVHPPYCYRCAYSLSYPECDIACANVIERTIQAEGTDTVIAVMVEPIIGGGGVIVPPDEYLPKLRDICDRYEILLILDEVITGFGRTGTLFAHQRCSLRSPTPSAYGSLRSPTPSAYGNVQPDIITLAKGISSGYLPLGACVAKEHIFEAFTGKPEDRLEFAQVSTYGGHPVCCAAGLANLKIMLEEKMCENAEQVGNYLMSQLKELIRLPIVGDIRGKGLIIAIELVEGDKVPLSTAKTKRVQQLMKEHGILVGRVSYAADGDENILYLAPPLILTKAEADKIVAALNDSLDRV
ncbi:aminotransferase class III-fold pyridoxal phosphate-dependent enzyme [Candidatus Poribacteria bacterium]|nr:aminotransferase class III-fold pyridoxal phosphate-dependent enzyme [Candidatus Poribacteria bacterium]